MKRSEMEKIIADIVLNQDCWGTSGETAREILDAIEKAGMLPPDQIEDPYGIRGCSTECEGVYEWEPENEA